MSDPLTQLEHLELPPVPQPEAAVVRRRGDAIRRRRHATVALGAAAAMVAVALVVTPGPWWQRAEEPQPVAPTTAPTETPTESETPHTTPPPPFDIDLAAGYPASDGDGKLHPISSKPGVDTFELCHRVAFDPHTATTGSVEGASYSGPEDARARTLVEYADAGTSAAAFQQLHDAVLGCPVEGMSGTDVVTDLIPYEAGQESFGIRVRYRNPDVGGFDTGLTLYHVVRYRQLLLVTMDYGEGNGSPETRDQATRAFERADQPVVDQLPGLVP